MFRSLKRVSLSVVQPIVFGGAMAFVVVIGVLAYWFWPVTAITEEQRIAATLERLDTGNLVQIQEEHSAIKGSSTDLRLATFLRGLRQLRLGHPAAALDEFAEIQPTGELRLPLLTLTGEALYQTGQLPAAQTCLEQAVREAPEDPNIHRWLATVYYDLGRMDRTLAHLNEVARLDPEDYRPQHMRGVIYQEHADHDDAIAAFRAALALAPDARIRTDLALALARSHSARNEFAEAQEALADCLNLPETWIARAECAWNLGEPDRAEMILSELDEAGSQLPGALLLKSRLLLERRDSAAAVPLLKQLIEKTPQDGEAQYLLAMAYQQQGEESLYLQHLQRSEELKQLKVRLTALSQQAMQEPDNAEVRDEMADVCGELGMTELAQVWRDAASACRAKSLEGKP